jgi:hypothetical protein
VDALCVFGCRLCQPRQVERESPSVVGAASDRVVAVAVAVVVASLAP